MAKQAIGGIFLETKMIKRCGSRKNSYIIKLARGQGRIVLILFNAIVIKIPKNTFGILSSLDELIRLWKYKEFRFFLCPRIFF